MRKLVLLLLGVMFLCGQLLAQNRTVSGKVTDEQGFPLPNASVVVKGSSLGTTTSQSGTFSLNVPATATVLVFTLVGMEPIEVAIGSSNTYNVTMKTSSNVMEDVVVVGYGSGRQRGNLTGSVVTVDGSILHERPSGNALDALQGRVAGMQVFSSNGEPSVTPSFRIRGVGSLGSSSTPLVVLDGVQVDPGTLVSLNPEDFESITVLKDAASTSIYGSRAANGVLYITTKKGNANRPATITVQSQYGVSNLINKDFFNGFMNAQQLTDFWLATGYRNQTQVDNLLNTYPNDTKWYQAYYNDNVPMYQGNIQISGGGGKTTYHISGGYFNQEGLAYRSGFERFTFRSNLTTTVNDWFRMGLNLSGGYDERQTNPYGSNSTNRGLALLAPPFYTYLDENGERYKDRLIPGWGRYDPQYLADKNTFNGGNAQFNPSAYIQVNPINNLTLKVQSGLDASDYRVTEIRLPSYVASLNNGSVSESFTRNILNTVTSTAEYKFNVNDIHDFTILGGHEYIKSVQTNFNGSSTGQTDDRLVLINAGPNNRNSGSGRTEYAYQSFFGRVNYGFNNKYFLDLTVRQDQSSRFGIDNRTANFYSVGLLWKAKSEDFLANVGWLTDLNVRSSYGTQGNSQIGNYLSQALVGTSQYESEVGWTISSPGNPRLQWESQAMFNFGFDAVLFDRANVTIDLYNRNTSDMLVGVPYAYTSGFSQVTENVGSMVNRGIDVDLSYEVIRTSKASLRPYVNFNYNQQKVTELFQGRNYWIIPNTGVSWAVGQPVSFFYPVFAGVDPATGNPQWYLPNENPDQIVDPRMDKDAVTSNFNTAALQQNTGIKRNPPFAGGFGLSGNYGGLFLNADFAFVQGKYLINNDRYFFENPNQFAGFNQATNILDYWKEPGDIARYPRYGVQFTQFDSRLIEDASFTRLKNLTVGFNLPEKLLQGTKVFKAISVYATGRNLITFTDYSGPDPEVDSNLTLGVNPNTKQYTFGINAKF